MKSRIETIDIAKGLGIICVVLGHIECLQLSPAKSFIYQFHIPLFFFLSGLFYKSGEPTIPFIRKKINTLYLPAIIFNTIFLLFFAVEELIIGNTIIPIDLFKHWIKLILGFAVTPMGGATWFLYVLFRAFVLLFVIDRVCSLGFVKNNKTIVFWIVILCLSTCGCIFNLPFSLGRDLIALLFISIGKECGSRKIWNNLKSHNISFVVLLSIITAIAVYILSRINIVDISQIQYGSPILMILASILGIVFCLSLSETISRLSNCLTEMLSYIGQNTLWILLFHFFAFKLVTIVQTIIYHEPVQLISDFPTHHTNGFWPIVYLLSGLFIPLLLVFFKKKNKV